MFCPQCGRLPEDHGEDVCLLTCKHCKGEYQENDSTADSQLTDFYCSFACQESAEFEDIRRNEWQEPED